VRLIAIEALACYSSIGNKFSIKEIIYQLVDKYTYDHITARLEQENLPFLDEEGVLCFPYLDQLELNAVPTGNTSAMPTLSRRDSMNSQKGSVLPRGHSSGRKLKPPPSGGLVPAKRTVSANQKPLENLTNIEKGDVYLPNNNNYLPKLGNPYYG